MSLTGPKSSILNDVIRMLATRGIPTVVAAGNFGQDACNYSPASAPSAIVVGAADMTDALLDAPATNRGSCVRIYAPGEQVPSTVPGQRSRALSGSSMATPHVSGALANWMSEGLALSQILPRLNSQNLNRLFGTPRPILYTLA